MDQSTDPRATSPTPTSSSSAAAAPVSDPVADLTLAPLPTAETLRRRRSLPVQAVRFAVLNARIMRMVLKGHH